MKSILTLIIILAMLIGISICCHRDLTQGCATLHTIATSSMQDGSYLPDLTTTWMSYKMRWHVFLDHRELRDIDLYLKLADEAWQQQDLLEYRRWVLHLLAVFDDLPLREKFSLVNVF